VFLFRLHLDLELFVGNVVESSGVGLQFLLSRDLCEHGWRLSEVSVKLDGSPSTGDFSSTGLDHSSIKKLVGTFFNDHIRD